MGGHRFAGRAGVDPRPGDGEPVSRVLAAGQVRGVAATSAERSGPASASSVASSDGEGQSKIDLRGTGCNVRAQGRRDVCDGAHQRRGLAGLPCGVRWQAVTGQSVRLLVDRLIADPRG